MVGMAGASPGVAREPGGLSAMFADAVLLAGAMPCYTIYPGKKSNKNRNLTSLFLRSTFTEEREEQSFSADLRG
jgi:hypothetical protein